MRKQHLVLVAATVGVALLGVSRQAFAASYASQVSVSGTGLSFDLNESVGANAPSGASNGDVMLYYNGTTQDLGALAAGPQSATLNAVPTTPVEIAVTTHDGNGYLALGSSTYSNGVAGSTALQIDPATISGNPIIAGGSPSGLAIDTNPKSATFGNLYLANYSTNSNANIPQIGVYILNPNLTFQGASATETAPLTNYSAAAGLTFAPSGNTSPWRLAVGSDGYLYIGDWSTQNGGIFRAQLSATQGLTNGVNILSGVGNAVTPGENHSDIVSSVIISGSTATGDLAIYAIDTHNGSNVSGNNNTDFQQLYQWNVGASTSNYAGAPVPLVNSSALGMDSRFWQPQPIAAEWWFNDVVNVNFDLARGGPANQFYVFQSRSTGNQPDLFVVSPNDNKTVVWDSLDDTQRLQLPNTATPTDYLLGDYSGTVSPDGRFLMEGQTSGASFKYGGYIIPLLAGIPDVKLSTPYQMAPTGSVRQSAFDPAGNIYAINATSVQLNGFGPGGTSVAVTGSDGTFTVQGTWTGTAGGNLNDTSKWLVGNIPNGTDQTWNFGGTGAAQSVSINASNTVGAIYFTSTNGYNLTAGGGTINMNGLGVNFFAQSGTNTIAAPVTINQDAGLYAGAGASLTISGAITYVQSHSFATGNNSAPDIVKGGAGTVSVSNLNLLNGFLGDPSSGNLDIYNGKLVLLPHAAHTTGVATVNELSVMTNQGASLDLTNNDMVYTYKIITYNQTVAAGGTPTYTTTSPLSVVQGLVASAYDNGKWDGMGITSSTAAASKGTSLAVAENSALPGGGFTTFDGQPTTSTTVLVKYTWYGDLNLDGVVNSSDLTLMADGNTGWIGGDLNYDGTVNADDWGLFMLGSSVSGGQSITAPEPASLGLLALAAIPMIRRRRA